MSQDRAARATVLGLLAVLAACTAVLELSAHLQAVRLVPACLVLGSAAATVVTYRSAARMPGRTGRPRRALALVPALLAVGQAVATFGATGYDLGHGGVADVPRTLAVPVAITSAVLLLPPRARRQVGSRMLLDGAVVTVAVGVVGHLLLGDVLPGVRGAGDVLVSAGYPAAGALLCGIGLITVTGVADARRRAATWLLLCFTAAAVVAVSGALARPLGGTGVPLLHAQAWMVMLAAGVCAVGADPGGPPGPEREQGTLPLRGVVLAHGAAVAALLAVIVAASGSALSAVDATGGAVLVVLSSARTVLWALDGRRLTRRLQRTEDWFRALVHSGDAVTVVLDDAGRVGWASGPVQAQLGWSEAELAGRTLSTLLHDGDRDLVDRVAAAVCGDTAVPVLPATARLRTRAGAWQDVEVSGAAPAGAPGAGGRGGLVLHLRDVTDRRSTQRELERLAYTDFLTGLPNRARFMAALAEASAGSAPGCLLLVDLDGFKAVNDVAGHDAGDRLLCEVADTLCAATREGDVVGRLGGDEFAVLVRGRRAEATALAERLVVLLDRDHRPPAPDGSPRGGLVLPVSGSVGVVQVDPGSDPTEAVRRADLALRAAKAAGKNCVRCNGEALDRVVDRRARLARELPGAITDGRLSLVFQPVVGAAERRVLGLEALVRWRHPDLGDIPPEEFVGLAEDEGVVVALERWVLGAATAELARLLAAGHDLQLGVNVSVRHLQAGCLAADVTRALAASGVPARRLMLEITESVLLGAEDPIESDLATLREIGCVISLDDFGKGYSTLARLARLPVDVLKMDRGFVAHIEDDARSAAVVASVVELGRTLGMDVVAEGVETPGQLAALRRLGCRHLQGFLLGRPVPAAELPAVLAAPWSAVLDRELPASHV